MRSTFLRGLGFLAVITVSTAGCFDTSNPTPLGIDDAPLLEGSAAEGLLNPNPMFRALGPSFELSTVAAANGLLTAAAESSGSSLRAARRAKALDRDEVKTETIDPRRGGTIELKKAGMKVVIPAGALPGDEPIDITIEAYEGKYHVYEFLPHGLQFNEPIRVEFDVANVKKFGK